MAAYVPDQLLLSTIKAKLEWPMTRHLRISFDVRHGLLRGIHVVVLSWVPIKLLNLLLFLFLMLSIILVYELHAIFNIDIIVHGNCVEMLKNRANVIDFA